MKRKILLIGSAVFLLAGGIYALKNPFFSWRERRLIATAQAQFDRHDYHSASLGARAVLQVNPDNVPAHEILALVAEGEHSPIALLLRQKLVQFQPGKPKPLLDLANTATALGETSIAEAVLNEIPASERSTVAFHQAAAGWSMALGQYGNAERHFQQALELEPGDRQLRLNLATVRLALAPPGGSDALRKELEALQKEPDVALEATRALLAEARRRGDTVAALKLARELHSAPGGNVTDQLLYLEELQHAKSPEFEAELDALRKATNNSGTIYAIMEWMNSHGLAAKTVAWHGALPATIQAELPEPLAVAEASVQIGDWKSLRSLINKANWGPLEFLRLAYEARLLDERSPDVRTGQFTDRWQHAVNSTAGNANGIAMLARLVQSWGWKNEASQLWWLIANRNLGQRPALTALYELATADKNTRELYRISRRIFEIEPANAVARNNVAMFALLVQEDMPQAQKLAEEDYKLDPTQPVFVSTYAFSLFRQNRMREAADLLSKLSVKDLEDPSTAACYGVALNAIGEKEKAKPFLELALREKARLFPEEAALVAQALAPQTQ